MNVNIKLIKLIKENQVITIIIACVIVVLITYLVIFAPLMKNLRIKYVECRNCENQILDARNLISYARNIDKSYAGRVLISEKEAAAGVDEFIKHGKALGINFVSVKPRDVIIKEGSPYKILPIELDIEAQDKQLVDFMGSIDELKKAIKELRLQMRKTGKEIKKEVKKKTIEFSIKPDLNYGYVIKDGQSTFSSKVKIQVNPVP